MINVLVAYDDMDHVLGDFFQQCYYDLIQYFKNSIYNIKYVEGSNLNKETIQETISSFEGEPFICLAFSHGTKDSLEGAYGAYIDRTNCYFFGKSFFYTFSCEAGEELGSLLIDNECQSFIGYKNTASVILLELLPFIKCANQGIKCFFEKQNSLEVYNSMLNKYEDVVDELREQENIDDEVIATLTSNKNALILHGRVDATLDEFIIIN